MVCTTTSRVWLVKVELVNLVTGLDSNLCARSKCSMYHQLVGGAWWWPVESGQHQHQERTPSVYSAPVTAFQGVVGMRHHEIPLARPLEIFTRALAAFNSDVYITIQFTVREQFRKE
jgi:hypothetical protein